MIVMVGVVHNLKRRSVLRSVHNLEHDSANEQDECTVKDLGEDTNNMECPLSDVHAPEGLSSLVECTRKVVPATPVDKEDVIVSNGHVGDGDEALIESGKDGGGVVDEVYGDEELESSDSEKGVAVDGGEAPNGQPCAVRRDGKNRNPTAKAKSLVKPKYLTFLLSSGFKVDKIFFSQLIKKHEFVSSIATCTVSRYTVWRPKPTQLDLLGFREEVEISRVS
ncbi:unnamed protein product [Arabis nemorensis]|uniref:Uncharacterized protein n=1 Tax=Arabis nemorensis TaxID=586526 RepID=A0A565CN48_9BRAS|nr:unnamed protein product [Arabis nemorensis]